MGPYTIEFWEDEHGRKPVLDWIKNDLTPTQRRALGTAMRAFLERLGPDVCASQWGKWVAPGIAEFRLRMTGKQVVNAGWATDEEIDTSEKLLLRVFFHVHGDKIIMLVEGYDKGAAPSAKAHEDRQRAEAAAAMEGAVGLAKRHARTVGNFVELPLTGLCLKAHTADLEPR